VLHRVVVFKSCHHGRRCGYDGFPGASSGKESGEALE